jgi:hypothetical protein
MLYSDPYSTFVLSSLILALPGYSNLKAQFSYCVSMRNIFFGLSYSQTGSSWAVEDETVHLQSVFQSTVPLKVSASLRSKIPRMCTHILLGTLSEEGELNSTFSVITQRWKYPHWKCKIKLGILTRSVNLNNHSHLFCKIKFKDPLGTWNKIKHPHWMPKHNRSILVKLINSFREAPILVQMELELSVWLFKLILKSYAFYLDFFLSCTLKKSFTIWKTLF